MTFARPTDVTRQRAVASLSSTTDCFYLFTYSTVTVLRVIVAEMTVS